METTGIDWSKVNIEEELRGLSNEKKVERMGLVKIIMENNIKMLEMQKTIENIERQKEEEIRKREEKEQEKKKKTIDRGRKVMRGMKEKERRAEESRGGVEKN